MGRRRPPPAKQGLADNHLRRGQIEKWEKMRDLYKVLAVVFSPSCRSLPLPLHPSAQPLASPTRCSYFLMPSRTSLSTGCPRRQSPVLGAAPMRVDKGVER